MNARNRKSLTFALTLSILLSIASRASAQSLFGSSNSYQLSFSTALNGLAAGDFNGDGKLDFVAVGTGFGNTLQVFLGNGDGTFQPGFTYSFGAGYNGAAGVVAGDFNNDGTLDLAVTTGDFGLMIGNGDGTFQAPVYHTAGFAPDAIVVGDFNGDGNLDAAVANTQISGSTTLGGVSILLGNGFGAFQSAGQYSTGNVVYSNLTAGDLNNDGHLDLVTSNFLSRTASVLLANGDGTFKSAVNYASGLSAPASVALGDFNGDGNIDLTVGGGGSFVSVMLGKGDGTLAPFKLFGSGKATDPVAVGDFNADGKLDIVVGNEISDSDLVGMLLGYGDGTFYTPITTGTSNFPTDIVPGDFNNDGLLDLLVETGSVVAVFLNTGPYPIAALSASTVNFGKVKVGTTSASQWVTLTNTGNAALQISSIALAGANRGDFLESNTCGQQLGFGANCAIRVAFRPTYRGTRNATVTITDNNPGAPQQVISLTGYGLPAN